MSANEIGGLNKITSKNISNLSMYKTFSNGKLPGNYRDLGTIYENDAGQLLYDNYIRFDALCDNHIYKRGDMECLPCFGIHKVRLK